jgi:cystathionine gamma-lyase
VSARRGNGTRAVHAGLPKAAQGAPYLPGPTFASAYHLAGDDVHAVPGYLREGNPTWAAYEAALGELEGGEVVLFASGMAACAAVLLALEPGQVLAVPDDCYFGVRVIARDHLTPRGVEVRSVPTDHDAVIGASAGATMVWIETPSNPKLDVLDVAAVRAGIGGDATLVVDNTLATPLVQRPLELGADISVASASKMLTGHSDLLLGYVAVSDPERAKTLRAWRGLTGAIPGPFEAWLAHRSLATVAVRLERATANAGAIVDLLQARPDVTGVSYPGFGSVLGFELADAGAVARFFAAAELVTEATSFGGVHTNAERRGRWGSDAVAEGFIRFSAGIEDVEDLLADLIRALDAASA